MLLTKIKDLRDAYDLNQVKMAEIIGVRFKSVGKIYYFAVASYSKYDNRIMGELSRETFARPKRK